MQIKTYKERGSVKIKVLARDSGVCFFPDEFYEGLDPGSGTEKKVESYLEKFLEHDSLRKTEQNPNFEECSGVDGIYEIKPGDARIYVFEISEDVFVIANAQMKSEGRQSDMIGIAEQRREDFFSEREV